MKLDTKARAQLPGRIKFLLLACFFEITLGIAALCWAENRSLPVSFQPALSDFLYGVLYALPLFALNGVLYYSMVRKHAESPYARFFNQIIVPLCKDQTFPSAVCIGIVSGFGEELFFRGALTAELALHVPLWLTLLFVNALFAYVHFIGAVTTFGRIVFFYFLFGLYFSFMVEFQSNLATAVISHSFYNTTVILFIRARFSQNSNDTSTATY